MEKKVSKLNFAGLNLNLSEKLKKELKYLEPSGASKRTLYHLPKTFDGAYNEMYSMQKRYNDEREKLRQALNSPIKATSPELPLIIRIQEQRKTDLTPKFFRKIRTYRDFAQHSPLKSIKPSQFSYKRLELIDNIVKSCNSLDKVNKSAIKYIPTIETQAKYGFKTVNEMVDAIEYMSPSNELSEYISFKRNLKKNENKIFRSKPLESKSPRKLNSYRSMNKLNQSTSQRLKKLLYR